MLAVITVLIALAQLDRSYTDAKVDGIDTTQPALSQSVNDAKSEIAALRAEISRLTNRVLVLERARKP